MLDDLSMFSDNLTNGVEFSEMGRKYSIIYSNKK